MPPLISEHCGSSNILNTQHTKEVIYWYFSDLIIDNITRMLDAGNFITIKLPTHNVISMNLQNCLLSYKRTKKVLVTYYIRNNTKKVT